jgi:hypothetical protein
MSNGTGINLNPNLLSGITTSGAYGTNGSQQVGYGEGTGTGSVNHAMLWNGTSASAVDLNPSGLDGITTSVAYGIDGTQQVGNGSAGGLQPSPHALLWTGTAASAVDLNPSGLGITQSQAYGISGPQQVGFGSGTVTGAHALLWTGTAASAVDLAPTNLAITNSYAFSTSGGEQVGEGSGTETGSAFHALMWNGSAASAVDLNPTNLAGIQTSDAYGTNGIEQVGYGYGSGTTGNVASAMLWAGTAASAVNLQTVLPATGTWTESFADTVDSSGNVYGFADGSFDGVTGQFAVEWLAGAAPGPVSWAAAVSGGWTTAGNWVSPVVPDSLIGVNFNTGSAAPYTVTLGASASANSIDVQDNVTIQKAGFNLDVPGAVTIAGTSGQHASLALAGNGLSTFGSLAISSFGQLDITDNTVIINYGAGNSSPAGLISRYIKGGYNGAAWNGIGIVSSKVASVNATLGNPHAYAVAYADASDAAVAVDHFTPGTVVIEPAIVGDANLDGKVNFSDFQLLAANFNQLNTSWDQGDFNYGGITNFTDFQLLAANFNDSTSLDNAQFDAMNSFAQGFGDSLVANSDGVGFTIVPEPVMGAVLGILGAGIIMRRRRPAGKVNFRYNPAC